MMELLILWTSYVLLAFLVGFVVTHYIRKSKQYNPDAKLRTCITCKNCILGQSPQKKDVYMCVRMVQFYEDQIIPRSFGPAIEERKRVVDGCGPSGRFYEARQ